MTSWKQEHFASLLKHLDHMILAQQVLLTTSPLKYAFPTPLSPLILLVVAGFVKTNTIQFHEGQLVNQCFIYLVKYCHFELAIQHL
jgi:hypothetical protein